MVILAAAAVTAGVGFLWSAPELTAIGYNREDLLTRTVTFFTRKGQ